MIASRAALALLASSRGKLIRFPPRGQAAASAAAAGAAHAAGAAAGARAATAATAASVTASAHRPRLPVSFEEMDFVMGDIIPSSR
jgi:hypothetical protein